MISTSSPASNIGLISVVIPTYNRENLICEAIESVLSQSYAQVEVIVVDDGSTDTTLTRLQHYRNDARVHVLRREHLGASEARNAGIQAARGTYVAFLDSDDLFVETKLDSYAAAVSENPDAVLFHSYWTQKSLGDGAETEMTTFVHGDGRHDLLKFAPIATPCVMVDRATLLQAGGFRPNLFPVEDYDMWCRIAALGTIHLIRQPLSIVRLHPGNSPRDPAQILHNQQETIRYFFDHCDIRGLQPRNYYTGHARYSASFLRLEAGDHAQAARFLLLALVNDIKHDPYNGLKSCGRIVQRLWTRYVRLMF